MTDIVGRPFEDYREIGLDDLLKAARSRDEIVMVRHLMKLRDEGKTSVQMTEMGVAVLMRLTARVVAVREADA